MRPGDLAAGIRLADLLEQSGDSSAAMAVLRECLEASPSSAAAHYRAGRLLAAQRPDRAIAHLEAALAAEPDYREALYTLASAYRAMGRGDEADEQFRLYERADPTQRRHYPDPLIDLMDSIRSSSAQAIFTKGHGLQRSGDFDGARAAYDRALEIDPGFVQANVNLVTIFGQLGDHESARLHYERAVSLDPGIAEAHYNYGVSLHFSGDFRGAADAFRKALELNGQNADAHGNLATSLEQLGHGAEAEKHYGLALRHDPSHPMANFHSGRRLADRGRYRDAVPYLERALRVETTGSALHGYVLALVHRQLGQHDRARAAAEAALSQAQARNQAQLAAKIRSELLP